MAQQSHKNHYIPRFYTKRWTATDGRLCEFSKPYDRVICRKKYPSQVGWKDDLYTLTGAPPGSQTILEDKFFSPADQMASEAVDHMISYPRSLLPTGMRSGFTRLLLSFLHRTPDRVLQIREEFTKRIEPLLEDVRQRHAGGEQFELLPGLTFEETLDAWKEEVRSRQWGKVLKNVVDSEFLGGNIINMQWRMRQLDDSSHTFLTGDKPLIHNNGIGKHEGHIALALSPTVLFLATNNEAIAQNILGVTDKFLVSRNNHEIATRAKSYVYGDSERHLRFVERRLCNASPLPTPRLTPDNVIQSNAAIIIRSPPP